MTLELSQPGGGTLGTLSTTTDADGFYFFPTVPPNTPLPSGMSPAAGDGYTIEVTGAVCGGTRDVSSTGETLVQAGRTTTTSFTFNCQP